MLELGLWVATLLVVLFSLRSALLANGTTFAHDNLYWGFPFYRFYVEEILSNRFSLWNPFSHGGESLITAYLQLRMFDPLSAMTAKVAGIFIDSATQLFSWDRVVRTYLGCVGAYLVIRDAVASRFVRLTVIPIIGLSSLALNSFHQNALMDQFYCAVFAIFFLLRILESEDYRWRNWIGVAIFFGVSIQSYFFSGGTLAFVWLLVGMLLFRRSKLQAMFVHEHLPKMAASIAIVSVMALPMLVYFFQLSDDLYYSARFLPPDWAEKPPNGGPFDDIRGYVPNGLNSLRMPYAVIAITGTNLTLNDFLTLWSGPRNFLAGEAALFIGSLPFAIALLGMVAGKHPAKRVWMTFLLGMIFMALGRDGGVHNLLYHVLPPLWFMRHTHALSPFILLALIFFFAIGFQYVLQIFRFRNAERWIGYAGERGTMRSIVGLEFGTQRVAGEGGVAPQWLSIALLACALVAAVASSGKYIAFYLSQSNPVFLLCVVITPLVLIAVIQWAMQPRRARFENLLVWYAAIVVALAGAAYQMAIPSDAFDTWRRPIILALGLSLLLFTALRFRQGGRMLVGAVLASLLITLTEASRPQLLLMYYISFLLVPLIVGLVLWLNAASRLSIYLMLAASFTVQLTFEFVRSNEWIGTPPTAPAIDPGAPPRLLPRVIVAQPPSNPVVGDTTQVSRYLEVLEKTPASIDPLRTYPRDRTSLTSTDFSQIKKEGVWNSFAYYRNYAQLIFSNLDSRVLEKIFLVGELPLQFRSHWVVAADLEEYLRSLGVERAVKLLDSTVVLADGTDVLAPRQQPNQTPQSTVRVLEYTYDRLAAEISSDRPGILYFADGFDPSWKASVNGASVPILRANGNFKAVAVPEGRSTVVFEYAPVMFILAIRIFQGVFVIGLLFIFIALLVGRVTSRRPLAHSQT